MRDARVEESMGKNRWKIATYSSTELMGWRLIDIVPESVRYSKIVPIRGPHPAFYLGTAMSIKVEFAPESGEASSRNICA